MKKTIWKFPLKVVEEQVIKMPRNAHILGVQVQRGEPCIWALVEPDHELEDRVIGIFGTGNPFPVNELYNIIGTIQMHGGDLVWHVFEMLD